MKRLVLALAIIVGASGALAQTPQAENALIAQANAAMAARNWPEAERLLKQLIVAAPNRWDYQKGLADAQGNQGRYQEAAATYDRAIALAEKDADAAKAKPALAAMWLGKGNMLLMLKNNAAAIAAYNKAAALDPNPAVAYWNICATMYNLGNTKGAAAACDKAIAADPKRPDAYFIKGSVLLGDSKVDAKGNMVAPPGTVAALRKYLELAPNGGHAADVKEMLKAANEPVTTTYQKKK
jgi:tetratricopeptide (TPR) repeat protein